MENITFTHKLTEKAAQKNAIYQFFGRRFINKAILLWFAPLFGIFIIGMMIYWQEFPFIIIFLALFLMLLGPLTYLLLPITVRAKYRKNSALFVDSKYVLSDESIDIENERGTAKYYYNDFSEARQNKEFIFLYIGLGLCIPLEKAIIGEDATEKILSVFKEKIGNKCKF